MVVGHLPTTPRRRRGHFTSEKECVDAQVPKRFLAVGVPAGLSLVRAIWGIALWGDGTGRSVPTL